MIKKFDEFIQERYSSSHVDWRRFNKEEFCYDADKVHDEKYDYTDVIYKGVRVPVTIICPKHGEFQRTPYEHISLKHGCKECEREEKERQYKIDIEEPIFAYN